MVGRPLEQMSFMGIDSSTVDLRLKRRLRFPWWQFRMPSILSLTIHFLVFGILVLIPYLRPREPEVPHETIMDISVVNPFPIMAPPSKPVSKRVSVSRVSRP